MLLCFTPATLHRPKPRTAASHAPRIPWQRAPSPVHRRFWTHASLPRNERLPAEAPGGFHLPPPNGDPRFRLRFPVTSQCKPSYPGGDEDFDPILCGVVFFLFISPEKRGRFNHLQIFSYTSLFVYSNHVVFDTCAFTFVCTNTFGFAHEYCLQCS